MDVFILFISGTIAKIISRFRLKVIFMPNNYAWKFFIRHSAIQIPLKQTDFLHNCRCHFIGKKFNRNELKIEVKPRNATLILMFVFSLTIGGQNNLALGSNKLFFFSSSCILLRTHPSLIQSNVLQYFEQYPKKTLQTANEQQTFTYASNVSMSEWIAYFYWVRQWLF